MAMPKIKLIYFNIPGKAEPIRLALTYMGIEFEDFVFSDRSEFDELKASGKLMFGQVPALEVTLPGQEPLILNQTHAILRHVTWGAQVLGFRVCRLMVSPHIKESRLGAANVLSEIPKQVDILSR